jgi:hypothetical protein
VKHLYEYNEDFGRMGTLTGRLLLTKNEYQDLLSKEFHADDVLGKHSEIDCELTVDNLKLLTDDETFLALAEKLGIDLECGFDPRCYIDDEEVDEEE